MNLDGEKGDLNKRRTDLGAENDQIGQKFRRSRWNKREYWPRSDPKQFDNTENEKV